MTPKILVANACTQPIALSGSYVYWPNQCNLEIQRIKTTGGTVANISAFTGQPEGLFVTKSFVYWSSEIYSAITGSSLYGLVERAPISGGSPRILANVTEVEGLTVSGNYVYFCNEGNGIIDRVPVSGGASVDFASVNCWQPIASKGYIYWDSFGPDAAGSVNLATKKVTILAMGFSSCEKDADDNLLVNGNYLYWTENCIEPSNSDAAIDRVPIAGGSVDAIYSNTCGGISVCLVGLGISGNDVVFSLYELATNPANGIYSVPNTGGSASMIVAGGQNAISDVVTSGSQIYYSTELGELNVTQT